MKSEFSIPAWAFYLLVAALVILFASAMAFIFTVGEMYRFGSVGY